MARTIAFLRAINVGGHTVRMERLRELFESLGLAGVETFIASGNVIFDTRARDKEALARRIEEHLHGALGYEVHTFLRSDAQVAAIARSTPFPAAQMQTAGALSVGFMAKPPAPAQRRALLALRSETDDLHLDGRELWWCCRVRQSESVLSNNVFEKALQQRATFRGIGTLRKLAMRYPAASG